MKHVLFFAISPSAVFFCKDLRLPKLYKFGKVSQNSGGLSSLIVSLVAAL